MNHSSNWANEPIKSNAYTGAINRDYEKLPRFKVSYPGQKSYISRIDRTLEEMQIFHPQAEVEAL